MFALTEKLDEVREGIKSIASKRDRHFTQLESLDSSQKLAGAIAVVIQ
jgi:hypothetical protein